MKTPQQILSSIQWPEPIIILDFETYWDKDFSLKKMSIIEYLFDDRFEFTGLGYKFHGCNERFVGGPSLVEDVIVTLQGLYGQNLEHCTLVVANDKFDISILKHKFDISPPYVIDIQNLDRHVEARALHAVEHMAKRWKVENKGDGLNDWKGLHWDDADRIEKKILQAYTENDTRTEEQLLDLLLPMLTRPEIELPLARITLEMFLSPDFVVDEDMAKEAWDRYEADLVKVVDATGHTRKTISGNISFEKELRAALGDEEPPMKWSEPSKKTGKSNYILAISKEDSGRDYLLTYENPVVRRLMEARIEVKSAPLHKGRVKRLIDQSRPLKGFLPTPLTYGTAHTGRWGGGQKINLQNLMPILKPILMAPDGYVVLDADQAQIEARMLAYLAGQDDLIKDFRNGVDIYSNFASPVLRKPVRKPSTNDPAPVAKIMKSRRQLGKVAILSFGFGCGADKAYNTMCTDPKVAPDLKPLLESGKISLGFTKNLVANYRKKYSKIPKFWTDLEKAFKFAARYPGRVKEIQHGIKFWSESKTVHMQLPSGRVMRYQDVRISAASGQIHWKYGTLWGGGICENIVQAASRDLIAENILALTDRGIKVALTVHDSILSVVCEGDVDETREVYQEIMSKPAEWCPGLPLAVEIDAGKRYG